MKLSVVESSGYLRISLDGELDHHSARETMLGINRALDDYMPRVCVIDMAGVNFMDSSGIALMLRIYKLLKESGAQLCVENPQRQPLKVIEAAGIDRVVRILTALKEGEI